MHPTMLQQVGHTLAAPNLGSHDLFSRPPKPSTLSVCVRTGPSPTAVFTCFDLQDLATAESFLRCWLARCAQHVAVCLCSLLSEYFTPLRVVLHPTRLPDLPHHQPCLGVERMPDQCPATAAGQILGAPETTVLQVWSTE